MFKKIAFGTFLFLFSLVALRVGLDLASPVSTNSNILGKTTKCRSYGFCRRDSDCCSNKCVRRPRSFWGRCSRPTQKLVRPSSHPAPPIRPTSPPKPTSPPGNSKGCPTNACNTIRSVDKSIDILSRELIKLRAQLNRLKNQSMCLKSKLPPTPPLFPTKQPNKSKCKLNGGYCLNNKQNCSPGTLDVGRLDCDITDKCCVRK